MTRIALLGDRKDHRSHWELNALRLQLSDQLGVQSEWVGTDAGCSVGEWDALWLVPGSPYRDEEAVVATLREVRETGVPFLGTCGGLQFAVIEYLRNALGQPATHAESDGVGDDNVVTAMACSLYGVEAAVTPVPGSRFAELVPEPFEGMHFCGYAPTPEAVTALVDAGVVVGATAADGGVEVLEFPDHPFYLASMFQPHIGALAGRPIHPLVRAFVAAAG